MWSLNLTQSLNTVRLVSKFFSSLLRTKLDQGPNWLVLKCFDLFGISPNLRVGYQNLPLKYNNKKEKENTNYLVLLPFDILLSHNCANNFIVLYFLLVQILLKGLFYFQIFFVKTFRTYYCFYFFSIIRWKKSLTNYFNYLKYFLVNIISYYKCIIYLFNLIIIY